MNYGKAMRVARAVKGIGQAELAKITGFSTVCHSQIENDHREPSLNLLTKVAEAFGEPLTLLVYLATEQEEFDKLPEEVRNAAGRQMLAFLLK